jgi:hypothetical protein
MTTHFTVPARVEAGRFAAGKRIAATAGFDAGNTFDRHVIEAFNAWGLAPASADRGRPCPGVLIRAHRLSRWTSKVDSSTCRRARV